ncbi:DciA family protein [Permianibacter aggregans]|uniref:Uncharacterized protein DUF721 n=1 Tax=Permianibacter aggregans TaxID=1510150 RepID=A0A4R6UD84_9GAMM|nr:DciA family protein [Permianibacter aggregans]TDQ44638.1 uncharacterized protein DUF721 [Permianibacter aggregans]
MNRPKSAQSIAGLLDRPDGPLKALLDRMAQFEALDHTLAAVLPASLKGQVRVTGIASNQLELTAAQAASATRLRYMEPQLLAALSSTGYAHIKEIKVRISANNG